MSAALVAWIPHVGLDEFFERLRPLAARCFGFIGHKMIYATQVERVVRRIGWQFAEPALRSLVVSLLVDRDTELLTRSEAAVQNGKRASKSVASASRQRSTCTSRCVGQVPGGRSIWSPRRFEPESRSSESGTRSCCSVRKCSIVAPVDAPHHQHEYAAAMFEEAGRVDPSLRRLLVLPAVDYLAHPDDEVTECYRRTSRMLDTVKVR